MQSVVKLPVTVLLLVAFSGFNTCLCACTDSYNVRENSGDQVHHCVDVSQNASLIRECVQISDFLRNDVSNSGCKVEIYFQQGQYVFTSYNININTSISMEAVKGEEVVITCQEKIRIDNQINTTIYVNLTDENGLPGGYVTLKGLVFQECIYSLRIDYVNSVTVENCTFRGFQSSGLDIYNCLNITVINSSFIENNVTVFNSRFRGDAAGLSIAHHFNQAQLFQPNVFVKGTEFRNNKAVVNSDFSDQINKALNDNTYPARGGGLSLIVIEEYVNVTILIDDCIFIDNFAAAFGGAAYLIIDGEGTNHSVIFSNTKFIRNKTYGGGGSMFIGYINTDLQGTPTITEFSNVLFEGNSGLSSGGVLVIQTQSLGNGNFAIFRSCNFTNNVGTGEGAAIVFGSLQKVLTRRLFHNSIIDDCIFTNNTSSSGVLIVGFTNVESQGHCRFIENNGAALRITGSLFEVKGNISFVGNKGVIAGRTALYITAFGQIKVYKNSHLSFIDNQGSIGAAIRIELQSFPQVYVDTVDNPLCFLQYEDPLLPPSEWQENQIHFSGNTGNLGSAIFASSLEFCSFDDIPESGNQRKKYFDINKFKHWPIFNFSVNYNLYHYGGENDTAYYIQTPAVAVEEKNDEQIYLRPNDKRQFNLTGLDQFGSPTFFVARIIDSDNSFSNTLDKTLNITEAFEPFENYSLLYTQEDITILHFTPNLLAVNPKVLIETEYSIEKKNKDDTFQFQPQQKQMLIEVQNSYGIVYDTVQFQITTLKCLSGFELRPTRADSSIKACMCVGAVKNQFAVLDCNEQKETIILRNGYWAGKTDGDNVYDENFLSVYSCPITYCQCIMEIGSCTAEYHYYNSDLQCHPPREGPLCGSCGNNSVVTILRLQCDKDCNSPEYTVYIATVCLIIIDSIVIIAVILVSIKFSLHFPNTFKSILFYLQTAYISTEYFPISFWDSRQSMLYLGNMFALYFPVDFCFVPDAPSVLAFVPRFLPVILMVLITSIFFFFQKARRGMWNGVWTLVLLLYTPIVHTCVMLVNCPLLPDLSGRNNAPRWFLDASILCFNDTSHLILGIFAILFLLVLVMIIPLIIILMIFENTPFVQDHHPFLLYVLKTLKFGYRQNLHWMSCIELIKRLVIVDVVVGGPGRTVLPIYIISFLFVIHVYIRPYERLVDNVLEAVVLLNYILLLVFRSCQAILDFLDTYTGLIVPSNVDELPNSYKIIIFFSIFFYFPIVLGIVSVIVWIIHKIWEYVNEKWTSSKKKRQDDTPKISEFDKVYYRANSVSVFNHSGRVIPVTKLEFES